VSWHSIRGHDRVVADLRRSLEHDRFPHALLFVGPEGIGKKTFARKLAQALLCEVRPAEQLDPCEVCPGCLQVEAETHPDFVAVGRPADKHELPIAVIRDLCEFFALKPARGLRKVAILDDADDLNEEAANAFLKTLEEPPPGAVLILVGTSAEVQLPTIVSRCQVVRFEPLTATDVAEILLQQGVSRDRDDADRLAALGDGSVTRALGLADAALERFRRALIDELALEHGFDPPALAHRVLDHVKQAGKESVDQRRRASLLIGELSRFFRGVLWQTAGLEPPCPDAADRHAAESLAARLEPEDVLVLADRCLEADYHVQRRLALNLILWALAHDLGKILNIRG
jgi:DNA polymerase III subunit delta'